MQKRSIFKADTPYGDLSVDNYQVYTPGGPLKNDMVYTPIDSSPTINVLVYAHFGGSPKIKVQTFTVVISWIFKSVTQYIQNNIDSVPV